MDQASAYSVITPNIVTQTAKSVINASLWALKLVTSLSSTVYSAEAETPSHTLHCFWAAMCSTPDVILIKIALAYEVKRKSLTDGRVTMQAVMRQTASPIKPDVRCRSIVMSDAPSKASTCPLARPYRTTIVGSAQRQKAHARSNIGHFASFACGLNKSA